MSVLHGRPHRSAAIVNVLLLVGLALSAGASLLSGPASLHDAVIRPRLLRLRLGRTAAAGLAGSALAVAGVLVQGLFRNPLACPSVLGTTSGAALGGQLALLLFSTLLSAGRLGGILSEVVLPAGCLLGALAALSLLVLVARVRDDLVVLLLSGFLLSALFISLGGLVTSLAQDEWDLGRAMVIFTLGDVTDASLRQVLMATPLLVAGLVAAWLWGRSLDVMLSGEDEAATLGVEVEAVRRWVVLWTAILTGAAVAVGGSIAFVGLVVPHVLRPFVGAEHRRLAPAAALLGGGFVILCDVVCRLLPSTSAVPLGVITGLIGSPTFLSLLIKSRRPLRGTHA